MTTPLPTNKADRKCRPSSPTFNHFQILTVVPFSSPAWSEWAVHVLKDRFGLHIYWFTDYVREDAGSWLTVSCSIMCKTLTLQFMIMELPGFSKKEVESVQCPIRIWCIADLFGRGVGGVGGGKHKRSHWTQTTIKTKREIIKIDQSIEMIFDCQIVGVKSPQKTDIGWNFVARQKLHFQK